MPTIRCKTLLNCTIFTILLGLTSDSVLAQDGSYQIADPRAAAQQAVDWHSQTSNVVGSGTKISEPIPSQSYSGSATQMPSEPISSEAHSGSSTKMASEAMPAEMSSKMMMVDHSSESETVKALTERINKLEEMLDEDNLPAFTADYNKGFRITPRDKKKTPFELKVNGRLQFRWAGFDGDSDTFTNRLGTIDVPNRNDFEVERGRLELKGYAIDPRWKYYFNLDADTDDNHQVIFHDFWFDFDIGSNATVRIGKAKVPASFEWLESSTTTRFSDRSLSTTYFRADRSVGVWLLGETANKVNYQLAWTNGFNTTDLEPEDVDDNFAYTALFYKDPFGDYGKGYSDLKFHESPVIRWGSSWSYTNTEPNEGSPTAEQSFARVSDGAQLTDTGALGQGLTVNEFDQFLVSAFIAGKYRGFSFNSEYYARWLQNFETVEGGAPGINELFDSGFYTDVGYFLVPGKFEVLGRVSQIDGLFGDSWEYAAGFNYFHNASHKSKITFDASILPGNPTSSSSPNFEIGQDGVLYRLQYQIAF